MLSKMALQQACALLAAGSIGAGSVVTVQEVRKVRSEPAVQAQHGKSARKPARHRAKPRPQRRNAPADCPPHGAAAPVLADIGPQADAPPAGMTRGAGGDARAPARSTGAAAGSLSGRIEWTGLMVGGGDFGGGFGGGLVIAPVPPGAAAPFVPLPPSHPPTSAIPEAATWLLMLSGFGLIGWTSRRRSLKRPAC